jgi:hypothetical protein
VTDPTTPARVDTYRVNGRQIPVLGEVGPRCLVRGTAGTRVGKLVMLRPGSHNGYLYWECSCDCGGKVPVQEHRLLSASKTDCGCVRAKARQAFVDPVSGSHAIVLTSGRISLIDEADMGLVTRYKWSATLYPSSIYYAVRAAVRSDGGKSTVFLHRLIMVHHWVCRWTTRMVTLWTIGDPTYA